MGVESGGGEGSVRPVLSFAHWMVPGNSWGDEGWLGGVLGFLECYWVTGAHLRSARLRKGLPHSRLPPRQPPLLPSVPSSG